MEKLEAKGIIERYIERPRIDRKAYTVYENKAIAPQTKSAPLNVPSQRNNRGNH